MLLLRSPGAYAKWTDGGWRGQTLTDVPIQERVTRDAFRPIRGHDGQRLVYHAAASSTNPAVPTLGLNTPRPRVLFLPRGNTARQAINQKAPLMLKGVSQAVSLYTTTALDALERRASNQ